MTPIILVPFFGDTAKFQPLLDRWVEAYKSSGCRWPWYTLGDQTEVYSRPAMRVDIAGFADVIRPGQPFDVKGALVCSAILKLGQPLFVLDADAFLAADPAAALAPFHDCPIAMPADHGAVMYWRETRLRPPYERVPKRCAGVQWFGPAGDRTRLVAGYRRAFAELLAMPRLPWHPQLHHLVEQYAWSICAHRFGGRTLPPLLNWHEEHLGHHPGAVINHHYGHPKWRGVGAPANV